MEWPPAWFHTRILVGAGRQLTPRFATEHGITHVINCAFPEDSPLWFRSRYPTRYACMEAHDSPTANILHWYPQFESYLHRFLQDGTGVVYVHCQEGINRSGFLTLLYVCKNFHLPIQWTMDMAQRQRRILFQNQAFSVQVRDYLNGRVSCEKDSGHGDEWVYHGHSGLCPPRDNSNPA